ncbi:hypothetical protein GGTG_10109 [Gaeumannomyces tritici R3-111a-1]|uniref:Carboxypeptidase n=1 Tax=Gaeumannomyces tritici (strain R3-111a-1) TaxID=644352 RepID=J3P9C6_GAET3|nr:hypothetical protein GGTG_10109 [Gaeumannomyces tritici R3-111a-1]EJT73262.1 hypothetical protein GGTG_10109 [Gaeumannomyces tritici R3-111a-1]
MRCSLLLTSLLASAAAASGRRSLAHVGKGHLDNVLQRRAPNAHDPQKHIAERAANSTRFLNSKTSGFAVNGTGIPDVNFDVGESYAGNLPISSDPNEPSSLFWWFFPSTNQAADKEILIWLNGGPGCSSLEGLLQENGPFSWQYGTFKPVPNPWSWHTLTNVVWIEQPVGTGFSTGKVTATSEEDVAKQFMGFWKNFIQLFDMQGYKVYIAGESYAGLYCPYIASAFLDAKDTTFYDMKGMMIYDPSVAPDTLTELAPVVSFVDYWGGLFPFNDTFRADIHARADKCGYTDFMKEYLVYPPKGPIPDALPGMDETGAIKPECSGIYNDIFSAISLINPCFDIYQVATTCPLLWDVLGFPGSFEYLPDGATIYFNRTDVKAAIHAPAEVSWSSCANENVFVNGTDSSDFSTQNGVMGGVIERTNNVVISHGALDMILLANGTLLAIQNTTWNGARGFQSPPTEPFFVPYHDEPALATVAGAGTFGTVHTERGLTYVGVDLAGHMVPQYAPTAAYRQLEFLLGRVDCMNCTKPFTTTAAQRAAPQGSRRR